MAWHSEALDPQRHITHRFEFGEPNLDTWLCDHATGAEARRVSRTFVWCQDDDEVVAYYSLTGHRLLRADLPKNIGRGSPTEVPAVLPARLALDAHLHGRAPACAAEPVPA